MNEISAISISNGNVCSIKDSFARKEVSSLSSVLSTEYYKKSETSSAVELNDGFISRKKIEGALSNISSLSIDVSQSYNLLSVVNELNGIVGKLANILK